MALALLLKRIADNRQLLIDVAGTIRGVTPVDVIIDEHLKMYQSL
jgi:hypothetical protein